MIRRPPVRKSTTKSTIGLDLGDRFSCFCILDAKGSIVEENRVATTPAGLRRRFRSRRSALIAMEAGSQSPWVSRFWPSWATKSSWPTPAGFG
jgi:hypothetical protein